MRFSERSNRPRSLPEATPVPLRKFHKLGTLERIQSRLGMFAWSARQAGLQVDLGGIEALQTFYLLHLEHVHDLARLGIEHYERDKV